MSENITDLIEKCNTICYTLIESEGLERFNLERRLEYLEFLIAKLGANDGNWSQRTLFDNEAND